MTLEDRRRLRWRAFSLLELRTLKHALSGPSTVERAAARMYEEIDYVIRRREQTTAERKRKGKIIE